jgi:REP element-mobilizing transposase RayT
MAATLTWIRIHFIFSTMNRRKTIDDEIRPRLWEYMGGIAKQNNLVAYAIGGTDDHIHMILSIPPSISAAKAIQIIKGGSSKWVNEQFPHKERFAWQQGYAAFSLSPSRMDRTVQYIRNQAEHHRKQSFKDEYVKFLKGSAVSFDEHYVLG